VLTRLKEEAHVFFNALSFFSRIPAPGWVRYDQPLLNRASGYLPLVGWILGGLLTLLWLGLNAVLEPTLSVLLVMAASVWLTGAFHEDGFADLCDGAGGGYGKAQILLIMKDSRLGTYGAVGLVLLLATKLTALAQLQEVGIALLVGYSLSRLPPVWLMYYSSYVRDDETSKARPVAKSIGLHSLVIASVCGGGSLLLLSPAQAAVVTGALMVLTVLFGRYLNRLLGGYTGDCLGALQQLSEVTIYICLGARMWNSI
jgi:adenosylcobinamide-GDP ribazoletransferase